MPSTHRTLMALTVMLVLYFGSAIVSDATPVAIGFPPPDVSVVGSGTSGSTGGRTFTYTVAQNPPMGYADLYWTMEKRVNGPLASTASSATMQNLSFTGLRE